MKQKKILVTGANGYIGQYLGELISRKDYNSLGTIRFLQKNKCLAGYWNINIPQIIDFCNYEKTVSFFGGYLDF